MSNKRFPGEFKIEAVKQVTDRGHAVSDVASRLGISHARGVIGSLRRKTAGENCRP